MNGASIRYVQRVRRIVLTIDILCNRMLLIISIRMSTSICFLQQGEKIEAGAHERSRKKVVTVRRFLFCQLQHTIL